MPAAKRLPASIPIAPHIELTELVDAAFAKVMKMPKAERGQAIINMVLGFQELLAPGLPESGIASKPHSAYDARKRNANMATAVANKKSKEHPTNGAKKRLTNFDPPRGDGWHQRFARGVTAWREARGLTIGELTDQLGVSVYMKKAWYDIEKGTKPQMTGARAEEICEAIKVPFDEILKLGTIE